MLNALYELGKLWIEKENLDKIDVLLDAEKLKKSTEKVILVELNQINENFEFNRVFLKDYDSEDNLKYLYKSGSSRGTDITPSCLITEPEKSFENKFFKWFDQNNEEDFLKFIFECLYNNKDQIYQEVFNLFNELDNKVNKNVILTLLINKEGKPYYVGDFNVFKEILIAKASEKYYKSGSKKIKGNSVCFLCDEDKEVYGLVSNSIGFAFSTPDKKGNVSELNIQNQWKQLPICGDCALYLEAGKKFVEKFLSFREFGLSYYVIPNFLFDSVEGFDKLYKRIRRFEDKKHYSDVVTDEVKFKEIFNDLNDILEFKFMFFKASNNAFDILAYVESILPSWMHKIFENQRLILDNPIFSEDFLKTVLSKDTTGNLISTVNNNRKFYLVTENNWYLGFLKDFFSGYSFKYYLEIVSSIISEKDLDLDFLLSRFMDEIRVNWRNQNDYAVKLNTLKSLALILLFNYLKLFKEDKSMDIKGTELGEDIISDILDTSDKKATFLLGVLTRRLTYVQFKELGSSPFINKLWGLSLDKKKIQKLYPMVLNKLQEYKRGHAYADLQEQISINLISAENNWNLTRDETSYYFVLGYTLAFAIGNDDVEENDEE